MAKRISLVFRIVVGIGILVLIFWSVDLRTVTTRLASISYILIFTVLTVTVLDRVLMAYKWNVLLKALGVFVSLWQATRMYFVGNLVGTFTPGGIGGDAYRVVALSGLHRNKVVASTVILERVIGLGVMCALAVMMLPFSIQYIRINSKLAMWAIILGAVLVIVLFVVISFFFRPGVIDWFARWIPPFLKSSILLKIRDLYRTNANNRLYSRVLLVFTGLTMLELLVLIFMNYLAARSLGIGVSFSYLLCVLPSLYILIRVPVSVQGIGVQEGLWAYFLITAGFSASDGLSISLLLRGVEAVSVFFPAGLMLALNPIRLHPSSDSP